MSIENKTTLVQKINSFLLSSPGPFNLFEYEGPLKEFFLLKLVIRSDRAMWCREKYLVLEINFVGKGSKIMKLQSRTAVQTFCWSALWNFMFFLSFWILEIVRIWFRRTSCGWGHLSALYVAFYLFWLIFKNAHVKMVF